MWTGGDQTTNPVITGPALCPHLREEVIKRTQNQEIKRCLLFFFFFVFLCLVDWIILTIKSLRPTEVHSPWNKLRRLINLEARALRSPSNKGLINYYHNGNAWVSNNECSLLALSQESGFYLVFCHLTWAFATVQTQNILKVILCGHSLHLLLS